MSALRATGADVIAIGGNHDNGAELDALRAWAEAAGVTLRGTVRDRAADHIVTGTTAGGEAWRVVALPFLSQRYAIHATEMFALTAAEANQTYADHIGRLIAALTAGQSADTVNIVTAHLTVVGAKLGGGERDAHTIQSYAVPSTVFPASTHYVALGHLHRRQTVAGPCPVHYSGSPLAVDFGEEENTPSVTIATVGTSAAARTRECRSRRRCRCVRSGARSTISAASTPRRRVGCASTYGSDRGPDCAKPYRTCCRTLSRCVSIRTCWPISTRRRRARRGRSAARRASCLRSI